MQEAAAEVGQPRLFWGLTHDQYAIFSPDPDPAIGIQCDTMRVSACGFR